ncbi:MAG: ATP-grasp domain-containing protein [bacterium]
MKLYFMLVRRSPPVPSPVLSEVYEILGQRGYRIAIGIPEEMVIQHEFLNVRHDLYILKSHTELSLSLAGILDAQGARLLNPYLCCLTTQNKIVTSQRLRAAGVPTPRCWVTGELTRLRSIAEMGPLIIKPYLGHRGTGIHIVHHPDELAAVPPPERPVLIQEYVKGPGEDLKVYVVGDNVFAVRKPFSAESFAIAGRPCAVSAEVRDIALRCGQALGLGLYGLDVIESSKGPVVVDLNFFPGYKGVPNAAAFIAEYIDDYARGRVHLKLPKPALPLNLNREQHERAHAKQTTPA